MTVNTENTANNTLKSKNPLFGGGFEARTPIKPIPGDGGKPLVGYTFDWIKDPIAFIDARYKKFGEIFWTDVFGIKLITMVGADANQFVFQNKDDLFSNSQGWDYFIGPFFTRGIMLLDFEEHRYHRRIMQAAFKKTVLEHYLNQMNSGIEKGIQQWRPNLHFEILPAIKQLTLDLATDVFMGYELGAEADLLNQAFVDTVRAGTGVVRYNVPGTRWSKGLAGRKVLVDFFKSQVHKKRSSDGLDLFSQLCRAETEEGNKFTDDDVINHMIFLMMAAHDTTTITLCTMFYHLAKNPDWQERLRDESLALNKSKLEFDDLEKMEGMTLVMKEALRLCAPVPTIPRKTVKETQFKGRYIPKDSMVNVMPYYTHYMEKYWPEPFRFDPARFAEHRREDKVHPYAYVPFGGGAHMCIGLHFAELQVKAILHQVLRRFRWSVAGDYQMPVDYTSLPVPADKLPVKLERIDSLQ